MHPTRRSALLLPLLLLGGHARAEPTSRAINHKDGLALRGLDPLAWLSGAGPRAGSAAITADWGGVTWRFASAANRARFLEQPEASIPRFGGFCAFGVARGYKVDIDPDAWSLRDGGLYLNYSLGVRRQWLRDPAAFIARAAANWPALRDAA